MKIEKKPLSKKEKIATASLIASAIAVPVCIFAKKHSK